jgi:PhoH-like ATPase
MHDPAALFHFQEHNIFIPMVVLEELDHGKRGRTDVARNVRQVSRFIDDLLKGRSQDGHPGHSHFARSFVIGREAARL